MDQTAGIYFHIPFCKQACHYCDFHFVTSLKQKEPMLGAMETELLMQTRSGFFSGKDIRIGSIYFGGGTPSILEADEIRRLIDLVQTHFDVLAEAEITLEANPDDLEPEKVAALKRSGINRFSIGIQSFFEEDLRWMNRAHRAEEGLSAIKRVQDAGFPNITADLIYGYPLLTEEKWLSNIDRLQGLGVPHVSAYSMTVEPGTALGAFVRKGREPAMDEEQSAAHFELLMDRLEDAGYQHYEISNWARPGFEAVHNSNYWKGAPYLGIGPSAHSFDGRTRQWNIANNPNYIRAIAGGTIPFEREELSEKDRFNEYVMTSLRTSWGLDTGWVRDQFGSPVAGILITALDRLAAQGLVIPQPSDHKGIPGIGRPVSGAFGSKREDPRSESQVFGLTRAGKLLADRIASDLFMD